MVLEHNFALDQERNGHFPALREMARRFTAPFWWHDESRPEGEQIVRNGTGCFVNTGRRDLLVTCNHVYEGWLDDRDANPRIRCQIGGAVFEPEERLIDRDPGLDIAVFDSSEILSNAAEADIHYATEWPPPGVHEGEVVIAGGFPGQYRVENMPRPEFSFLAFKTRVDDVSKQNITCKLELDNTFSTQGRSLPKDFSYGGASGGPLYRWNMYGIRVLELVGFVFKYSKPYDRLLVRPADVISEDGSIRR